MHGPPGLSNNKIKIDRGLTNDSPCRQHRPRLSPTGVDPNLNGDRPLKRNINRLRRGNPGPSDQNPRGPVPDKGHPNNLKRSVNRPNEQLSDNDRHKTHASHSGV